MEELTEKIKENYDTYSEFCECAGISIVELSKFIKGNLDIRVSQFIRIADALQISLDELRRIAIGVDDAGRRLIRKYEEHMK